MTLGLHVILECENKSDVIKSKKVMLSGWYMTTNIAAIFLQIETGIYS